MPAQNGAVAGGLAKALGSLGAKAVKEHANDPTSYGNVQLPPGITSGVAQLTKCYFDKHKDGPNQGKYFFRAAGVVVEPKEVEHNGQVVPVAGQQTSIIVGIYDVQRNAGTVTVDMQIANVLNEMRKLGGQQFTEGAGVEDLEQLAATLQESQPYFRFSTSQGKPTPQYPNPRTFENWHGSKGLENYTPPDDGDAVQDDTPEQPTSPPPPQPPAAKQQPKATTAAPAKQQPAAKGKAAPKSPPPPPEPEPEPDGPEYTDGGDIDALLASASDGDDTAQASLKEMAVAAGYSEDEVDAAASWDDVVGMIREPKQGDAEPAAEEEFAPKVDEVYNYAPVDPKTKKAGKPVECEVTAVNAKAKTCDLKNLTTKAAYKAVPFDKLIGD